MTDLEAALFVQRRWKAYRARKLVKAWVKITAYDGDVFYKNKVTKEMVWEVPPLPAMSQYDVSVLKGEVPVLGTTLPELPEGGSSAPPAAPAPALAAVAGGGREPVYTDDHGDKYVVREGRFFFFDGPDSTQLLEEGWRRHSDETGDVWYTTAKPDETVWDPSYTAIPFRSS